MLTRSPHDRSSSSLRRASRLVEQMPVPDPVAARSVDVLSDALQAVRLTGALFFVVDVSTPWVSRAPPGEALVPVVIPHSQHLVSYHLVSEGVCWCSVPGEPPMQLEAGDVVVVPHMDPYLLSSAPGMASATPDVEMLEWFRQAMRGEQPAVVQEGGTGPLELQVLCGFLGCDRRPFNPLLATLPRMLRIRPNDEAGARLSQLVRFAVAEARRQDVGSDCVLLRLGELIFVEMLRVHLSTAGERETGLLAGLRDSAVGQALVLLHADPAHSWTLAELSRRVGRSRSALAYRFTELIGLAPMHYLAQWRMQMAAQRLSQDEAKVSAIAGEVGYESEAAFTRAFKKLVGVAPGTWRRERISGRRASRELVHSGRARAGKTA